MDELGAICDQLLRDSHALAVLFLDEDGLELARAGDAALFEGGSLLRWRETLLASADAERFEPYRNGESTLHASKIAQRHLLLVLFDLQSSLGLVRLRTKKASENLARVLERGPSGSGGAPARAHR